MPQRKPGVGARLARSHPLAKQMALAFLFNERSNGPFWNAVNGKPDGTFTAAPGSDYFWDVGPSGPALQHAAASGNTRITFPGVTWASLGAGSLHIRLRFHSADSFGAVLSEGTARGLFARSTGALQFYPNALAGSTLTAGTWYSVAVTRNAGSGATTTIYVDGRVWYVASTSDTAAYAFNSMFDDTTNESFFGRVEHAYIWVGRCLTPSEVQQLHRAPYDMFQPIRRAYKAPAGGGSVGSQFWWNTFGQVAS